MAYKIDTDACVGCGTCASTCRLALSTRNNPMQKLPFCICRRGGTFLYYIKVLFYV